MICLYVPMRQTFLNFGTELKNSTHQLCWESCESTVSPWRLLPRPTLSSLARQLSFLCGISCSLDPMFPFSLGSSPCFGGSIQAAFPSPSSFWTSVLLRYNWLIKLWDLQSLHHDGLMYIYILKESPSFRQSITSHICLFFFILCGTFKFYNRSKFQLYNMVINDSPHLSH